jgi:aminomethyltransferase
VELVDGTPVLISRTGYTGEFGFELFVSIDKLAALWSMVLEAGRDKGVLACGLAARDSLRAGAVLPLSHQDIGPWSFLHNPWPFALPYNDDNTTFSKDFIGGSSLLQSTWSKHSATLVQDARNIMQLADKGARVLQMGAGFIG